MSVSFSRAVRNPRAKNSQPPNDDITPRKIRNSSRVPGPLLRPVSVYSAAESLEQPIPLVAPLQAPPSGVLRAETPDNIQPASEEYDARIFIHPSADVSGQAQLGPGCRIWQQVQIRERAILGQQCNLGKGVYIDRDVILGSCVKVQNYVSIYQGVMIESGVFIGPHVTFTNDRYPRALHPDGRLKGEGEWELECTLVGYGASIGARAVILPGVRIGAYAMIGAGAVVTRDVPEHGLVIGHPARLTGYACKCGRPLQPFRQGTMWRCQTCQENYLFNK